MRLQLRPVTFACCCYCTVGRSNETEWVGHHLFISQSDDDPLQPCGSLPKSGFSFHFQSLLPPRVTAPTTGRHISLSVHLPGHLPLLVAKDHLSSVVQFANTTETIVTRPVFYFPLSSPLGWPTYISHSPFVVWIQDQMPSGKHRDFL